MFEINNNFSWTIYLYVDVCLHFFDEKFDRLFVSIDDCDGQHRFERSVGQVNVGAVFVDQMSDHRKVVVEERRRQRAKAEIKTFKILITFC
jgi:hypothetical protein